MKKILCLFAIFVLLLTCCKTKSTTNEILQKLEGSAMVINHSIVTEKKSNKNASDNIKADTSFSAKYFKKWLKDTLVILNKDKIDTSKMQLLVASDSLLFIIKEFYNKEITRKITPNEAEDVEFVIALLDECDELPKVNFKLSFCTCKIYEYSNILPNWIDAVFTIEDTKVYYKNKMYVYSYNRGVLNGRYEYKVDKNGVEKYVDSINFIWSQDGKLSKE